MTPVETVAITIHPRIRRCREDDIEALEWMGAYTIHRDTLQRVWQAHCRGTAVMLVAEADSFPVAQLWVDLAEQHEPYGLLWAIRVLPGLRGAGLGRALVGAGERILIGAGRRAARLSVDVQNARAAALYRALGYAVIGEQFTEVEHRLHDGTSALRRERQLVLEKQLGDIRAEAPGPTEWRTGAYDVDVT